MTSMNRLRNQTEYTREQLEIVRQNRKVNTGISIASTVAGGAYAFSEFGSTYGILTLLTTVIPSLANQRSFDDSLAQSELQNALWLDLVEFWFSQNDLWLQMMGEYCYGNATHDGFMQWMQDNGARVEPKGAYAPSTNDRNY